MRRILQLIGCMLMMHLGWTASLFAQEFEVGTSITLHATKPVGVPLHRKDPPNYWKHIPTETQVILEDINSNGKWLIVRMPSGEQAWVSTKYIRVSNPLPPSSTPQSTRSIHTQSSSPTVSSDDDEKKVWQSRSGCEQVVRKGGRMSEATSATLRIATWNIRWFPIGHPKDQPNTSATPTDIDWLVCTLVWMQLDVLTVQETLSTSLADTAWNTVTQLLAQQTGAKWKWYRQPCGRPNDHHIGLLWNDSHVELSQFESLWQFNSKANSARKACTFGLRPGQYVRVTLQDTKLLEGLFVPQAAIQADQQGAFVLLVDTNSTVVRRNVELGHRMDNLVLVIQGVEMDEQVIVKGLQQVRPGMVVTTTLLDSAG